jgi:ABC transporter substrate binding protein
MKRRQFISLLGGASLSMRSMIALAETNGRMPKVAVLIVGNVDDPESTAMISAFEGGMRAAGWTKDVNVHLDYRRGVAMQRLTTTIPIVFAVVSDPVGQGVVPNLAHPGGNVTGFSNLEPGIGGKWLELLKEIAPGVTKVAVMFNPATSPYNELFERSVEDGARTFGVQVSRVPVHDDAEIAAVFERLAGQPDAGLLVPSDAFNLFPQRDDRRARRQALAAGNLSVPPLHDRGRPRCLRGRHLRADAHDGVLRRSHPQRRQARRPAGPDADQVHADHQSEDGESARSQRAGASAGHCRRGNRIGGRTSAVGPKRWLAGSEPYVRSRG